jgi:hypothetical protein
VQAKFTTKGGKDQGAMMKHSQGPRRKDQSSYDKTPYLDRGDDDAKKPHMKGLTSKIARKAHTRKMGPNLPLWCIIVVHGKSVGDIVW